MFKVIFIALVISIGLMVDSFAQTRFKQGKSFPSIVDSGDNVRIDQVLRLSTGTSTTGSLIIGGLSDSVEPTTHTALIDLSRAGTITNNTANLQRVSGIGIKLNFAGAGANTMSAIGVFIERVGGGDNNYALITSPEAGNVGIGTISPAERFHVYNGTAAFNSDVSANECRIFTAVAATCPTGSTSIDAGTARSLCAQCD